MSGQHTPGPWSVEDPMGDGVDDYLWIVVGDQSHNWRCLALVSCDAEKGAAGKPIYRPQRNANARLIAAAPDGLALAEWIAYHWCNQDMSHADFRVEAFKIAEEFLAKALATPATMCNNTDGDAVTEKDLPY